VKPLTKQLRPQALLCALALAFCALIIHPVAEIGIIDDWSYIKSAEVFAQTGHIVYNGWSNPMVGWQLLAGALFIKVLGFSFTAVRMSALFIGMLTAFLIQRSFVRAGLLEFNATVGTLTFVLSPLYLPLALTYMTDLFGLLGMVVCFYACLRALQAADDKGAAIWICVAAVLNALGGTARQIAWLGVLVMVPSTLWLLRRRNSVLLKGTSACVFGYIFVFAALHWYNLQIYSVQERIFPDRLTAKMLITLARWPVVGGLQMALCLSPVLLMFIPALRLAGRRALAAVAGVAITLLFGGAILERHHVLVRELGPWIGPSLTVHGALESAMMFGELPIELHTIVRLALTSATVAGLVSFIAVALSVPAQPFQGPELSSRSLAIILGPCTLAYTVLLLPRLSSGAFIDRYLLYFCWISLFVILCFYQRAIRLAMPRFVLVVIAVMAGFVTAVNHDAFAMFRARVEAIRELRSAEVPPSAIDGGGEFDAWSQVEAIGFLQQPGTKVPPGGGLPSARYAGRENVHRFSNENFPLLNPAFALSNVSSGLEGSSSFAPVVYHTWLAPHVREIYILKYAGQP
jgi:hypothetical protein